MATRKHKGDLLVGNNLDVENELGLGAETAQRALELDASGKVKSSATTSTELGYLSGVTSAIQTQIDGKADDADAIKRDGSVDFTADQSMGGNKLTNVATPTATSDVATKGYVDNVAEGLKPKEAVRAATTVAGTLATDFENGDSIDGVTLATGDRILLKDQAAPAENGIYVVAASGAPTRATDFDSLTPIDEINGASIPVQEGTSNAGKIFVQTGTVATLGTDAINFVFFNSVGTLVGGDGIAVSGTNISVDHDGEGLTFVTNQLALELDGTTLSKSASGLKLNDTAVTPAEYGSASETVTFTVDQQGRLTAASEQTISITSAEVTDFVEAAQDAVGGALADSASVDFTYDDGTNTISAAVLPAGVDHDALSNFVANEHVDHSGVSIVAGGDDGLAVVNNDLTSNIGLAVDISGTTTETTADDADTILIYDNSAGALRQMTRANFVGSPNASAGDIAETSFAGANNQTLAANVTGLAFANGVVRSFKVHGSIVVDATADLFEEFELHGIQRGADWVMTDTRTGDDSLVEFTITTSGQVQYTSGNYTGFVSLDIRFRAITTSI